MSTSFHQKKIKLFIKSNLKKKTDFKIFKNLDLEKNKGSLCLRQLISKIIIKEDIKKYKIYGSIWFLIQNNYISDMIILNVLILALFNLRY